MPDPLQSHVHVWLSLAIAAAMDVHTLGAVPKVAPLNKYLRARLALQAARKRLCQVLGKDPAQADIVAEAKKLLQTGCFLDILMDLSLTDHSIELELLLRIEEPFLLQGY